VTDSDPYRPLDEIRSSYRMRLLRGLRAFDWVTASDLFAAMDAPEWVRGGDNDENRERLNLAAALKYLVKSGLVDADRSVRQHHAYRLNAAGRAAIAKTLAGYLRKLDARAA
jgi:hypothetical protein